MAETSVVVVLHWTMLVMGRIAGLVRFVAMARLRLGMPLLHAFAGIGREGASLQPGEHAEQNQPCEQVSHERPEH